MSSRIDIEGLDYMTENGSHRKNNITSMTNFYTYLRYVAYYLLLKIIKLIYKWTIGSVI